MEIELKEISEFPAEVDLFERAQDLEFELAGMRIVDGVSVTLTIQNTDSEYFITGSCEANVLAVCARCLDDASLELTGEISFIAYLKGPDTADKYGGEEDVVELDRSERLRFSEQVRQALFSSVPSKPLCSEDCEGLCPECGVNRNHTECDCQTYRHDSRWDALGDLTD